MSITKVQFKTVDDYINAQPKAAKSVLQAVRKAIHEEISDTEEAISYNMATIKLNGKSILGFAGWKKHISIYPFKKEMEKLFPESAHYKTSGRGTIQFQLNEPLPLSLIRKIVKYLAKTKSMYEK